MSEADVRDAFRSQARFCDESGAPVTANILRTIEARLDRTTVTGRRTLDWSGDPRANADSVPLRLAGGVHALARRGIDQRLIELYGGNLEDAEAIIGGVIRHHDAELVGWLDSPPQTNETGRAAPIMAGLMLLAAEYGLPFELTELGASAGLNLNLDRFGYCLGDVTAGDSEALIQLAPVWQGRSPPPAEVQVTARHGVDQNPVRISEPSDRERLIAFCWPDQPDRMARLQAALAIADRHSPPLTRGDAADFVERRLAFPQTRGVTRVIYHTIFWTYLAAGKQTRIRSALARAGAAATLDRPLAWLRYDLAGDTGVAELHLQQWPGGRERHLASGHPHASRLTWHA